MGLFKKSVKTLVLGGGGARGLCHLGVLEVLEKNNLIPDLIVGTSMGAIIGAYYALYADIKKVKQVVKNLTEKEGLVDIEESFKKEEKKDAMTRLKKGIKGVRTFLATSRLGLDKISFFQEDIMRDELKQELEDKTFSDLKIKYIAVATQLDEAKIVAFTKGDLMNPVLASASIPGVFLPVEIDGGIFVDGGVLSNVAVDIAYLAGSDRIMAVSASSFREKKDFKNGYELLEYTMYLRAKEIELYKEKFADFLLEPEIKEFTWFDFSDFDKIVEKGRIKAEEHLKDIKRTFKGRNSSSKSRKIFFKTLNTNIEFR